MAHFFIDRPVFAWVIAIGIMVCGALAFRTLPVAQYPEIAPPTISVNAVYPGASAKAVEDSVTQVIEQQMTGIDGLDYMASTSSSTGLASITLTFQSGVDADIAQVQVQNKLTLATPSLPQEVQRQGVVVSKSSSGFLMIVALTSQTDAYEDVDLGDYVASNMLDPVSRLPGVGSTTLFGSEYAMRIWLDPDRLEQFDLMPSDIVSAVRAQNAQISAGNLGDAPATEGQPITATITVQSLMQTPEDFRSLPIRTTPDGGTLILGDVAEIAVGADSYAFFTTYNGQPAAGFSVSLATGANALDTAKDVKALLDTFEQRLPEGMAIAVPYDTTPFVEAAVHEVQKTLFEAIILVFLVILIFLQSLRATFVPMIAIPVVLLGTLATMAVFGFSINMLTLFAMVLAIGLLVDDAIVVVENVERVMEEDGLSPYDATKKSMTQISGALVGIVVVLSSVFVPMAFFPGSTGVIYRQFSITIVAAMVLSVIVALVLSPAICASFLKPKSDTKNWASKPADMFNSGFDKMQNGYSKTVERILRRRWIFTGVFAAITAIMAYGFITLPGSFLPEEDQGAVITLASLPNDAAISRTQDVMSDVAGYYLQNEDEDVSGIFTISGFSFAGRGANQGLAFASLNDWSERTSEESSAAAIAGRASAAFRGNPDGFIFATVPPPLPALGNASGFNLYLKDETGLGHERLIQARNQLLGAAGQSDLLTGVRPNGREDGPQFDITIDYEKAQALGVSTQEIGGLLSTAIGGTYINDYLDRGRIKRVMAQGKPESRMQPEDISQWYVRSSTGNMVPLEEVVQMDWGFGSPQLERYNGRPAVNIQGSAAPGLSSGAAMNEMEVLIEALPDGIGYEWSGISAEERRSGNQAGALYVLSILFIFLCLAALYESWTIPIAVLLVAPLGVAGAVFAAHFRDFSNDVFFQVGLLTTVGLAAKNAILIVEFAKDLEDQGRKLLEATMEAVRMRLRPILMTSLAFGFGVLPLALSTGAGAGAREAIGTAVLGGMVFSTVLGIFFAPLFYVMLRTLTGHGEPKNETPAQDETPGLEIST